MDPIAIGTKVLIEKGCRPLDIVKGTTAVVTEVKELGSEYSHNVKVAIRFTNGFNAGKTRVLYAHHPNRLQDQFVRLRGLNAQQYIEVKRK
jgi:hypothetical protein